MAYLFLGLHPDGFEDADSGWPRVLKRFAAEAWRRSDANEMSDEELHCCDTLVTRTLRRIGWRVLRVWEHELARKNEARLVRRIQRALRD